MPVTLHQLAKAAGVSVSTVSRALNSSEHPVNDATKQRILALANQLGYRPNMVARNLKTDRTFMVGIIVDNIISPFTPIIIRGIQDHLKAHRYFSVSINADWDPAAETEAIHELISRSIDGIIFVESWLRGANPTLDLANKPYVFVYRLFSGTNANSVLVDERFGAQLAVHVLAQFLERVQQVNVLALAIAVLLAACSPMVAEVPATLSPTLPFPASVNAPDASASEVVRLPTPQRKGTLTLEEALARRRSMREFSETPLSSSELAQLLWAAQGITDPAGLRTAPSAGALYPLEIYAVTREGVYHYEPAGHLLAVQARGDVRRALYEAALQQDAILNAPAVIVIAAVYARTAQRYGVERSPRYVHLEAGHAAQNVLLQAVALGLGAVPVGAFEDAKVKQVLSLPSDREPLYLIPVGHPR